MTDLTLDRSAFEAWLRSKNPGEIVGVRCRPCLCPVAKYLRESSRELEMVRVGDDRVEINNEVAFSIPSWASQLVSRIDGNDSLYWHREVGIRASTVLRLLAAIV